MVLGDSKGMSSVFFLRLGICVFSSACHIVVHSKFRFVLFLLVHVGMFVLVVMVS